MFNRIAKIVMIIVMCTTQVGEAFAFSSMPCAENDVTMTMANMINHTNHNMTAAMSEAMHEMNDGESVDDEKCCQKDCCCPMGIVSFAVIINMPFKPPFDAKSIQPLNIDSDIMVVFLNQPQRPPRFIPS